MIPKCAAFSLLVCFLATGCQEKPKAQKPSPPEERVAETPIPATPESAPTLPDLSNSAAVLAAYEQAQRSYQDDFFKKQAAYWDTYVSGQEAGWEEKVEKQKADWDAFVKQQTQSWEQYSADQQKQWQDFAAAEREKWDQYVRDVESKWGAMQGSTKTEWVDYSGGYDSKSYVDFKNGQAVFETLVEEKAANLTQQAQQQLQVMLNATLEQKDVGGQRILDGQIANPQALSEAAKQPISRGMVVGKDGVKRVRYAVVTALVPDHLRRRAERYLDLINSYSVQFKLDASLVLAITETESAFNPRAKSWANAYGLMQIVPKYAGRETWREIYGKDGIPSGEYLFDPTNNLKHGACYLHLLMDKHWSAVGEGSKKDFLVICSYNCGPGNVNKMVLNKYGPPQQHTDEQLFNLLVHHTPQETQGYLRLVTDRRPKWRKP